MEPMTSSQIREFLRTSLHLHEDGEVPEEVVERISQAWITDRIRACEWVMRGNDIIE